MSWFDEALKRLPRECRDRVDCLAKDFETQWSSGEPPDIAAQLPPNEPLRSCVLFELVRTDLEQRLRRGQKTAAEDYIRRFPELEREEEAQVELAVWEFRLTRKAGATLEDFRHRFPQLAE